MELENLKEDDFEIDVTKKTDALILSWRGSLHAPSPDEFLDPYFEKLLEVLREGDLSLICNFKELDYMNSASIPPLIQLLRKLAEDEITGEFIYDATRKVQTASFRALDVIARKSPYTSVKGD